MLYKSTFFTIIFLFFSSFSNAQNIPGYLGKKGMVEYHFNSPALIYLLNPGSDFMHEFRFSYVMARRGVIGIGLETYTFEADTKDALSFSSYNSQVSGKSLIFNYDFYFGNALAPIGSYIRLELKYLFGDFVDTATNPFTTSDSGTFKIPHFGLGYGVRRIFFDRMVFNVGAAVGLNSTVFDYQESGYRYLIGVSHSIRINLGVGLLLF